MYIYIYTLTEIRIEVSIYKILSKIAILYVYIVYIPRESWDRRRFNCSRLLYGDNIIVKFFSLSLNSRGPDLYYFYSSIPPPATLPKTFEPLLLIVLP